MVDFSISEFTVPPILEGSDLSVKNSHSDLEANTQCVERCIRTMTRAAASSCSEAARDTLISYTNEARQMKDISSSRKKFVMNLNTTI